MKEYNNASRNEYITVILSKGNEEYVDMSV